MCFGASAGLAEAAVLVKAAVAFGEGAAGLDVAVVVFFFETSFFGIAADLVVVRGAGGVRAFETGCAVMASYCASS